MRPSRRSNSDRSRPASSWCLTPVEPGAAPNLPDEALVRLGETLKQDITRAIPVTITQVLSGRSDPSPAERRLDAICRVRKAARAGVLGRRHSVQHRTGISGDIVSWLDDPCSAGLPPGQLVSLGIRTSGSQEQHDADAGRGARLGYVGSAVCPRNQSMVSCHLSAASRSGAPDLAPHLRRCAEHPACGVIRSGREAAGAETAKFLDWAVGGRCGASGEPPHSFSQGCSSSVVPFGRCAGPKGTISL